MTAEQLASMDRFLGELMPDLASMVQSRFGQPGRVHYKGPGQAVTEVDLAVERRAVEAIRERYPEHAIVGEEGGRLAGETDITWYIDPIDGTTNFIRGIPFCAVSIGAASGGRAVLGHVIDPLRQEHFHAVHAAGAWLNGRPIEVQTEAGLDSSLSHMQVRRGDRFLAHAELMAHMHGGARKTRHLGAIALEMAYVAAGRSELVFAGRRRPLAWWDIVAGWALIEEAGGRVVDADGGAIDSASSHLVAGAPSAVSEFLQLTRRLPS